MKWKVTSNVQQTKIIAMKSSYCFRGWVLDRTENECCRDATLKWMTGVIGKYNKRTVKE